MDWPIINNEEGKEVISREIEILKMDLRNFLGEKRVPLQPEGNNFSRLHLYVIWRNYYVIYVKCSIVSFMTQGLDRTQNYFETRN